MALGLTLLLALGAAAVPSGMVQIPAGEYRPFYPSRAKKGGDDDEKARQRRVRVATFLLDQAPVSNAELLGFLKNHPELSRSRIAAVFADSSYLKQLAGDFALARPEDGRRPATGVSWFVARAYCAAAGKRLPTTDEWEYAAYDAGRGQEAARARLLEWYARPNGELPAAGAGPANGYGVHDLLGVIWEWTLDFNSTLLSTELRSGGIKDQELFCGAGALGARDAADYATFMRYSFRASLQADYTTANLGFRCAKEVTP